MSGLTKRDALQLVNDVRHARVASHAIADRAGGGQTTGVAEAAFLGGLEAVLHHFLLRQGHMGAAVALARAMNDAPSEAEIAARKASIADIGRKRTAAHCPHGVSNLNRCLRCD